MLESEFISKFSGNTRNLTGMVSSKGKVGTSWSKELQNDAVLTNKVVLHGAIAIEFTHMRWYRGFMTRAENL